ncbi:hypothetical protein BKA93DRAFT_694783, partial [Sparassis latifolia]
LSPAVAACKFLVLVLSLICHVSRERCNFVLYVLQFIMRHLGEKEAGSTGSRIENSHVQEIPSDSRTLLRQFNLDPTVRSYICCPRCYCLY